MRAGNVLRSGDIILAEVQFTDSIETKRRPAVILFEEFGNIIVAGITSNTGMSGIPLLKKEGAVKDSVIKINYIFTISESAANKVLFHLSSEKKQIVFTELVKRLNRLSD